MLYLFFPLLLYDTHVLRWCWYDIGSGVVNYWLFVTAKVVVYIFILIYHWWRLIVVYFYCWLVILIYYLDIVACTSLKPFYPCVVPNGLTYINLLFLSVMIWYIFARIDDKVVPNRSVVDCRLIISSQTRCGDSSSFLFLIPSPTLWTKTVVMWPSILGTNPFRFYTHRRLDINFEGH